MTLRKTKENIETLTKKIVWEMESNIWIALKAELLEIEKQSFDNSRNKHTNKLRKLGIHREENNPTGKN